MSEPLLSPGIDPKDVVQGVKVIEEQANRMVGAAGRMSRAFDDFGGGLSKKARPGLDALKQAMVGTVSDMVKQLDYLTTANDKMARELAKSGTAAGRGFSKNLNDGLKAGGSDAIATVRAQKQAIQAEYERVRSLGWKLNIPTLQKLTAMGASPAPDDRLRLREAAELKALETLATKRGALMSAIHADQLKDELAFQGQVQALREGLQSDQLKDELTHQAQLAKASAAYVTTNLKVMETAWAAEKALREGLQSDQLKDELHFQQQMAAVRASEASRSTALARRQVAVAMASPAGAYSVSEGASLGAVRELAAATKDLGVAKSTTSKETSKLRGAQAELSATMRDGHSAARGLASGFGAMWLTWGNLVPLMAGAAVSNALVQMVKSGAEVQHSLTQIRVLAGESAESVGRLSAQMLDLARSGPFGPKEVAEAFRVMALAGLSAQSASEAVQDVLNFSLAGDVGLKEAADVLTSVGTAFKIGSDGYGYISDVIAKAAAESKSSVEDFSGAMKTASVINLQYGVTLEETAVGISLLANAGIRGTAAGTALRNMYADLSGRTKDVTKAMKELGVQALDPMTGRMRGTKDVFDDLIKALSQKTPIEAADFIKRIFSERGGKEAQAVMDGLRTKAKDLGVDTASVYEELAKKVADASGFAAVAAAEMSLTPLNQMKSVSAALQATLVESFESLQPFVLQISRDLKGIFASENFKSGLQDLAVGVGNIVKFVVEWSREIATVILAYKGFTSVLGVMSAVAAGTAAIGAAATATGVAFTGMSLAMRLATLANPILLAISAVITGLAAAWAILRVNQDSATSKPVSETNLPELNKALEAELKHINNVNQARREGITLMELEANQKGALAGAAAKSAIDVLRDRREQAAQALRDAGQRPTGRGLMGSAGANAWDAVAEDFNIADNALRAASSKAREDLAYNAELRAQLSAGHAESAKAAKSQPVNVLGNPSAVPGVGEAGGVRNPAREATKALTSQIRLLKIEQDNADRVFANTDAITKRNESLRGFSTELEDSVRHTTALAKAESQYNLDRLAAEKTARSVLLDPKASGSAQEDARATLDATVAELGVKKMLAGVTANIARDDAERARSLKLAADVADVGKVKRTEAEDAYQDELKLAKLREDMSFASRSRNDAELAVLARVEMVKAANHEFEVTRIEAEIRLQEDLARIALQGYGGDTEYAMEQAGSRYLQTFQGARRKRDTTLGVVRTQGDSAEQSSTTSGSVSDGIAAYLKQVESTAEATKKAVTGAFKGMEDALTTFVTTGKMDFAGLADSIISDLVRIAVRQSIVAPLAKMMGFSLLPFADGGAFTSGGVQAFANGGTFTNQIVDSPTLFKFANGTGMMGEAGAEAIMPLTRGADGKLGVQATGGGGGDSKPTVISITIHAQVGDIASKADVEAGMRATANLIASKIQRNMTYGGAMA